MNMCWWFDEPLSCKAAGCIHARNDSHEIGKDKRIVYERCALASAENLRHPFAGIHEKCPDFMKSENEELSRLLNDLRMLQYRYFELRADLHKMQKG